MSGLPLGATAAVAAALGHVPKVARNRSGFVEIGLPLAVPIVWAAG
jgi:hypothetical protein